MATTKINLYVDAEWYLNQRIFLIGYSFDQKKFGQLYGKRLNRKNFQRLLQKVNGCIFCYGPDVGMLEKYFKLKLKSKYHCVNLMKVFKDHLKKGSFKLKDLEERFGLKRKVAKYKTSIFTIWKDWKDKIKKKAVLLYNKEDVVNLVKLTRIIFKRFKIEMEYLHEIRLK